MTLPRTPRVHREMTGSSDKILTFNYRGLLRFATICEQDGFPAQILVIILSQTGKIGFWLQVHFW